MVEGVTVVAAAGNTGNAQDAVWYAPGNDPLVITVGCLDENQTVSPSDDSLCPISSRGVTEDGFAKPDLLAPGRKIVSALAGGINGNPTVLATEYPERITADGHHLRLSGTSMSTPMVTGAVALLLQNHPNLTPDQIKQLLVSSASAYPGQPDQAGTLNIADAISAAAHPPAAGLMFPVPVGGSASTAGSHAALWNGSRWTSTYWDGSRWVSAYLDSANWSGSLWTGSQWDAASFDGSRWVHGSWDGSRWVTAAWDGSRFDSASWGATLLGRSHWDLPLGRHSLGRPAGTARHLGCRRRRVEQQSLGHHRLGLTSNTPGRGTQSDEIGHPPGRVAFRAAAAAYDDTVNPDSRPRVFVSRRISDAALERIVHQTNADVWPDDMPPPRDELLRRVAGVDGLLSMVTDRVDDELLERAGPQLKVVSNYGVGVDHIDVAACTRRGVAVGNTPGVLTETTADFAFALLLAAARRVAEGYDFVRQDRWKTWSPLLLNGPDVHHATLGIVGFGRIGREVAKRGHGFDMQILYYARQPASPEDEARLGARQATLDEVLAQSDFLSLHVPLSPATHHLINRETLGKMQRSAILVNTSRGPVVDSDALYEALKAGVIAGAALDVTEPEPMAGDHKLVSLPNCLIVPHIASASFATRAKMASIAADNLLAGVEHAPLPACVNPEVYAQREREVEVLPPASRRAPVPKVIRGRRRGGVDGNAGGVAAARHNLPAELNSFVGREQELVEIEHLLGTTRLLTLVGTGGVGKTRLAQRVASQVLDRYPDGAWLIELAAVGLWSLRSCRTRRR